MFPLLNLLTSGIIIFIFLSKQPLFGKLDPWNSKGGSPGVPRSFLGLGFDQHCYPRMLSGILGYDLGEAVTRYQLAQHFSPSTYAFLRVLSVAPCGIFPRMCLHTIYSACDVSNDQQAASVSFDYLFDFSFGFLQMPLGVIPISLARVIWTIDEGIWSFPFKPCPLDLWSRCSISLRFGKVFCDSYLISKFL